MGESAAVPRALSQRLCHTQNTAHLALCLQPPVKNNNKVFLYLKVFQWKWCLKETGKWRRNLVEAAVRSQRPFVMSQRVDCYNRVNQDSDCFVCVLRFVLFALSMFFISCLWGAERQHIHVGIFVDFPYCPVNFAHHWLEGFGDTWSRLESILKCCSTRITSFWLEEARAGFTIWFAGLSHTTSSIY